MIIIGITGTLGAGKGTIVEYLVRTYQFDHYSSRTFLTKEVQKRNLPLTRDSLLTVANELREKFHPGFIIEELYKEAKHKGNNAVIESIRTRGEIDILRNKSNSFYLLSVTADQTKRYERILLRNQKTDTVSFEKFREDEEKELYSNDPRHSNLGASIEKADFHLINDTSKQDLYNQVDTVMEKILKS